MYVLQKSSKIINIGESMNSIDEAVENFHKGNFDVTENIALKILSDNINDNDALDVLVAVYLKTNHLNFLAKATIKDLNLIRKIAVFLDKLQMHFHSAKIYELATVLDKKDYIGFNNLGLAYENMHEDDKAIASYKNSIKITENYPAMYNLGVIYRKRKDTEKSIYYLKKALSYKKDDATLNYSLGMSYFTDKQFYEGYKYFLKRNTYGIENLKNFWDGSSQKDKTILVFCDYGFGDAIMYSRYFPFLRDYFKNIKVCCHPALIKLFENSFENMEFVKNFNNVEYDFSVLAMNLPYFLNMDFDNIPSTMGYLKADNEAIEYFHEKYFTNDKFKVGIFWLGGEKQKRNAKERSMSLSYLKNCFNNENIRFYSVQKDDEFDELKDYPQVINLSSELADFSKTAAAIKNLDLLVTIDSAPVHLAGSLGVKTLLMLPYNSEWRWFKDNKKTLWYDSVDIISQVIPYSWEGIDKSINEYLSACLSK